MNKKCIVTTTINEPTEAVLKFCEKKDWGFIVVGDKRTPHNSYRELEQTYPHVFYYHPDSQEAEFPDLSDVIGWNCIQRRNLGLIKAYRLGVDVVATIDDDNIPYDSWGEQVYVGREIDCDYYESQSRVFDPLSITDASHLWHRGFPVQLLASRHQVSLKGKTRRKVLVQADLWNGDPDVDAIARLIYAPNVDFQDISQPYCSDTISPFNSQNTFLAREVVPYYALFPHVGRFDDVWGSYVLQRFFPDCVIYGPPSVYQKRNPQDLVQNLEMELFGYRHTMALLNDLDNFADYLPETTRRFWNLYRELFKF